MARRVVLLGSALIAVVLSAAFVTQFVRVRTAEYDKWKTTGFGLHQVHRGNTCFLQLRDDTGAIVTEQILDFQGVGVSIAPAGDEKSSDLPWLQDCRAKIEQTRAERQLNN